MLNQSKLNQLANEIQQGNVAKPHEGNTSLNLHPRLLKESFAMIQNR